jgi:hypothetical protein
MTVLFLLAEFPPVNTTGAYRSFKFVNQLIDLGIQPIILTLDENDSSTYFNAKIDHEILTGLDPRAIIYKVKTSSLVSPKPNSKLSQYFKIFFSLKDPLSNLIKDQVTHLLPTIFEKHKPELVYVSLPPFSMGQIGMSIAEKYKIPLITDMRDLWAYWGSDPHQSYLHFLLKKRLERKLFNRSSKVIGVTPQLSKIFTASHPQINTNKFVTIFNGFDKEVEIENIPSYQKSVIKIGYTGSFYYNEKAQEVSDKVWYKRSGLKKFYYYPKKENWLYRSPYFFLKALHQLFLDKPHLMDKIEFHFIGREPDWLKKMIAEFQLEKNYFPYGFKSKQEVATIQNTFDVFLCTSEKVINGDHYCLPSKIFDYVGIGKPLLGFMTEGIQKEFILKSNMGVVTNPDNIKESMNAIEGLFQFEGLMLDKEYIKKFSTSHLSFQLAEVIKQL